MRSTEIDENFWRLSETALMGQVPGSYIDGNRKIKRIPNPLPAQQFDQLAANTRKDKIRRLAAMHQAQKLNAARTKPTELEVVQAMTLANS